LPDWFGRLRTAPGWSTTAAAWAGLVFWLYYAILRQVAGPLGPDENYFSHVLWLVSEGKRQYIDFYSHHLPTYFGLLKPLVAAMSASPADLSYLWALRALSGVIIVCYMGLAWATHRVVAPDTGRTGLVAASGLLLVFVVMGRMVEVRSDTIGLLLVNTAWAIVLCAPAGRPMLVAAFIAGLAIVFSARAAGMIGVFGICLLALTARSRDWAGFRALLALAFGFVAAGLALYLAEPEWVTTVIRACFTDVKLPALVSFPQRFLLPDRFPLVLMVGAGLLAALRMAGGEQKDRRLVIAGACAGQLLMIAFDPNPFQYVYGWAAVPAVLGLLIAGRRLAAYFPFAVAAAVVGLSILHTVRSGQVPPTTSPYRLTYDVGLDQGELDRLTTPDLVALMISDGRQKNLNNQLRVRSEVCRRLVGKVVATWDAHPVCLHDTMHEWAGLRWPALQEGEAPRHGAMPEQEFEDMLMRTRPRVFIWAHRWEAPRPLLLQTQRMLACCYDIYDGFALAKEAPH
jgi:hypothetical protein